jgi:hypothetical protein
MIGKWEFEQQNMVKFGGVNHENIEVSPSQELD